ncbi:MAG: hypothetical protein OCD01_12660 [Fibrobacterales bacterium]
MDELTLQDINAYLTLEAELSCDELIFDEPFLLKEITPLQGAAPSAQSETPSVATPQGQSVPQESISEKPLHYEVPSANIDAGPAKIETKIEAPPSADLFAKAPGWKPSRNQYDTSSFGQATDIKAFNQQSWEHPYYKSGNGHSHLLFGHGPHQCRVLLVTTWPFQEDIDLKAPFTGQDGELLSKMLHFIHVEFNMCYTTFLKKMPHKGSFKARELSFLRKLLIQEIALIKPDYILILGNKCGQLILETDTPFQQQGTTFAERPTYITYHPRELSDTDKKREAMTHLTALAQNF